MELIFDRTEADVLQGSPKGSYSHTDLNRVESAVGALQNRCPALDIYPGLAVKTDWGLPGSFSPERYPTQSQMARYLHNVRTLCGLCGIGAPLPETMEQLTWRDANALEQALRQVSDRIAAVEDAFPRSGEAYAQS